MILAIDAGNTNIVFALFKGEKLHHSWRSSTGEGISRDTFTQGLSAAGIEPAEIVGGILGSVVPDLNLDMKKHFGDLTGKPLHILGEGGLETGISVNVDKPDEVGADRLLNAVAAGHFFDPPLIILDFGTATTFDVVGKDGEYLGGVIAPGIRLSIRALHEETAKLPMIEVKALEKGKVTGKNTVEAMQSGIFHGYIGMIEGVVKRLREEHGRDLKVFATGGFAPLFTPETKEIDAHMTDLTLQGLRLLYERNFS